MEHFCWAYSESMLVQVGLQYESPHVLKNIGNKWKNHFFKMKGDIGMAQSSKKERNKEWLLRKAT